MRITFIAAAALSAILLNSVLASASQAQSAAYSANSGTIPVQNAPLQSSSGVAPAVGGYDPNASQSTPIATPQQAYQPPGYQTGQTYVAAQGYASERLDSDGGFSPEEIKSAGHRFFGKVSSGFASAVEYTFQKSGRPNGYIVGEEAGGAFVAGLRYGEGTLHTTTGEQYRVF